MQTTITYNWQNPPAFPFDVFQGETLIGCASCYVAAEAFTADVRRDQQAERFARFVESGDSAEPGEAAPADAAPACTSGHCDRRTTTTVQGYGFCGVCAAEQAALLDVPAASDLDVAAIVASVTAQQRALTKGQDVTWQRPIGKRGQSRVHPTPAKVVRCNEKSVTIRTEVGTRERVAYADVYAASWNSGAQEAA